MEEEIIIKSQIPKIPQKGSWTDINSTETIRLPKVKFDMDKFVRVTFATDFEEPREYINKNKDGSFYIFDCKENNEDKVITTSAWTLLRGLKLMSPLAGKVVEIVKRIHNDNGKQYYTVNTGE